MWGGGGGVFYCRRGGPFLGVPGVNIKCQPRPHKHREQRSRDQLLSCNKVKGQ